MGNKDNVCLLCGVQMDDNHFIPATFPGIDEPICCNCNENLKLMFNNFEERPGKTGYIVPDYSERLKKITGRSYLENKFLYFQHRLQLSQSKNSPSNAEDINKLKSEIRKISQFINKGTDLHDKK